MDCQCRFAGQTSVTQSQTSARAGAIRQSSVAPCYFGYGLQCCADAIVILIAPDNRVSAVITQLQRRGIQARRKTAIPLSTPQRISKKPRAHREVRSGDENH
jgi:hypothetical protein